MGVRHKKLPIEGVQFHPESILTESDKLKFPNLGLKLIKNFVENEY
jgi:anthranilate synthase component 2